jgi:sensor c-di-GMP phosphodiesterase-like protein
MSTFLATFADLLLKSAIVAFLVNEVRGVVLAVPVLYAMYQAGGTLMAIWLGVCSLGGIALSVLVPVYVDRRLNLRGRLRAATARGTSA